MSCSEKDAIAFINQMTRVSKRCMESVLSGKPKCHFAILHRLVAAIEADGRDGCIYVSELAKSLYDAPQAVSRGLRILEQDGLVERVTDAADRRKTMVRLTAAGRQAHDTCEAALTAYGASVTERMGAERLGRMRDDFMALLSAMEAEASQLETIQGKEVSYD